MIVQPAQRRGLGGLGDGAVVAFVEDTLRVLAEDQVGGWWDTGLEAVAGSRRSN